MSFFTETREVRACEGCGWPRKVKVTTYSKEYVASTGMSGGQVRWEQYCPACKLVRRAEVKEHEAYVFRARALKIKKDRGE